MSSYLPEELRERVRQQAGNRCGYCLSPQYLLMGPLEIEHIVPKAAGGTDNEGNLWLACRLCNGFKSNRTRGVDRRTGRIVELFHPRNDSWDDHFRWSRDGTRIIGRTACGRATVTALQLNNLLAIGVRSYWVGVGWHPPDGIGLWSATSAASNLQPLAA